MKSLILFSLISVWLFSCTTTKSKEINTFPPLSKSKNKQKELFRAQTLSIKAINLSEDMSTLSTKNDELFVFIYDYSDTNELNAPLVSRKFVFYKDYMEHSFSIPNKDNLILFFIEEDSFRESIEIEPIVRIYFKELLEAVSYDEVEKYPGVDDLLGTQVINSNTSTFTISGRSSLDKYEYSFVIK